LALALTYFVADKFWMSKHGAVESAHETAEHSVVEPAESAESTVKAVEGKSPALQITIPEKSVAVLPFLDMSEKKDQEYFSDGLSEELIDMLVKVPELRVPARTSSFYFKGKPTTIKDIAAALGVAHILEGSVRKSGNTLRITAQLIRVDNGYHVWSETYDRKVDDIFKVQDDIAGAVVAALKSSLLVGVHPNGVGTSNVAAYELYLQARAIYFRSGVKEDLEKIIDYLHRSLKLDSAFAPAWALLSVAENRMGDFSLSADQQLKGIEDARRSAQRALSIDDKLPEAHTSMARVLLTDQNWRGALLETQRAIELDPANAYALYWMGNILTATGDLKQAIEFYERSVAKDPLNPHVYRNLGAARFAAGQFVAAEEALRKSLDLSPNELSAHASIGQIMLATSRESEALAEFERDHDDLYRLQGRALALFSMGRKVEAATTLRELEQRYAGNQPYQMAAAYAYFGNLDRSFAALEQARNQKDGSLWAVTTDPLLKNLRSDPRYRAFLRKMKMAE
jgi:TolB-like protein/Tfp pilus assembly protein PilF